MLRIGFVTLFPEMVLPAIRHSVLRRGEEAGLLAFEASNPRDFATDPHRTVDGKPCGGGPGMVLRPDLVQQAIDALRGSEAEVVLTDPTGERFTQAIAENLSRSEQVIFVCGHYEGIDDRIRQRSVTRTLSVGDFVLTGGELPALLMADAIARLVPGVLGDEESPATDSHAYGGLLGYPQFTLPREWEGLSVPEVLLSGDHGAIEKWRRAQALASTRSRRPDLFAKATLTKKDLDLL